jgi:hypothetical protein
MSKLPYMQFYPSDFLMDSQTLTMEQRGAWITLICYIWMNSKNGTVVLSNQAITTLWNMELDQAMALLCLFWDRKLFDMKREVPEDEIEQEDMEKIFNIITSRRISRDKKQLKNQSERQKRFYHKHNSSNNAEPNANLTHKKLDVRSQKLDITTTPSTGVVLASPYQRPDKATDPNGWLVMHYKESTGVGWDDREWDKRFWARWAQQAKVILDAMGEVDRAISFLDYHAKEFASSKIKWTLRTIADKAVVWAAKERRKNDPTSRTRFLVAHAERGSDTDGSGLRETVPVGPILDALRDRQEAKDQNRENDH